MRRLISVLAGFVVLATMTVVAPASAQDATLTVTPSTELEQGEIVEIRGTGPVTSISGLGLCRLDADLSSLDSAIERCALLTFDFGGQSSLDLDWTARFRGVTNGGNQFDCRMVGCQIVYSGGAALTAAPDFVVAVPITFNDGPAVSVTPDRQLGDLTPVAVDAVGTGDATVEVIGCVAADLPGPGDPGDPGGCVDLDAAGPSTWLARRWIADRDGVVRDCFEVRCVIGVRLTDGTEVSYLAEPVTFLRSAQIEFDADGLLADGDTFEFSATNVDQFARNRRVVLCLTELFLFSLDPADCASTPVSAVDDTTRSTYTSTVTARRFIEIGDVTYDCAKPLGLGRACGFFFVGQDGPEPLADFAFDVMLFLGITPIPDLDVQPARDLPEVSTVDVLVDEPSADPAVLAVCPRTPAVESIADARQRCQVTDIGPHPARWETVLAVHQVYDTAAGVVDCDVIAACEVVYLSSTDEQITAPRAHRVILHFSARASIFPLEEAVDGQEVFFELSGYPSNTLIQAVPLQCGFGERISFDDMACRAGAAVAGDRGTYRASFIARRFIERVDADPIDCAQTPTRCFVVLMLIADTQVFDAPGTPLRVRPN